MLLSHPLVLIQNNPARGPAKLDVTNMVTCLGQGLRP